VAPAPRVSVVVSARNAEATLPRLLASLERQSVPRDMFDVSVVDDASTDATPEIVRASEIARLVTLSAHGGLFAAQNFAIEQTDGEVVAITDADCEVSPDWIERGLAVIDAGGDVVAGRFEAPLGDPPSLTALLDVTHRYDQGRYVREGHAAGANIWARRAVFDRIGGFDVTLPAGGDTEWAQRAVAAGFSLRYAPDMWVVHPALRSPRQLARRMLRQGRGAAERGQSDIRGRLRRRGRAYVGHEAMRDQLERLGVTPSRSLLLRMRLLKILCVRLPLLAGNLLGIATRSAALGSHGRD
jgi:glycosyltransferase involved in cell wall biosynthesis